jgi:putative peptide zinc metalloprotease protein
MADLLSTADLERRRQVRLRLRPDLKIETHRYEGRTYYVLKDPVSLRYYRIKEYERFLLSYFDGVHTLEDAQKAYEEKFRPDRLKLEELEAFAQQLLQSGLVLNDSPRAGAQLYERRWKRWRSETLQAFTNILYIKIPAFDPDWLLTKMLPYVRFIFTLWFFVLSVCFMMSAVILVATHFDTFRNRLPEYHQFFTARTAINLLLALSIVKVIHEFGHGLSCKAFGGECHEMGFLLMCLSPAMYCNVSDAWKMPNKWHRIIISFAGIYVELIIAAIATFVWWNTPTDPFINNLSLSLMIVCSISTVVFNANPLMRFDGYYVLADWLEIPNLRERSNRYLQQTAMKHCLGMDVREDEYMDLWRRVLFIVYAVVSYIYRWVVMLGALWFLYHFLRPYKLEIISTLLTLMALGSMFGWPLYRVISGIHRRGRLPDMKRWRVVMTGSVLGVLLAVFFFVPLPVSRVRGVGLVQAHPEHVETVRCKHAGALDRLLVRDGQRVQAGEELAVFSDLDLESKWTEANTRLDNARAYLDLLSRQEQQTTEQARLIEIAKARSETQGECDYAYKEREVLRQIKERDMVLYAPRSGVVCNAPKLEDVGKTFDKDASFCTIYDPDHLIIALPTAPHEWKKLKENVSPLSSAAEKTFRRLKQRVKVSYHEVPLSDVLDDLSKRVKGFNVSWDATAPVPPKVLQEHVSLEADNQLLSRVLLRLFQPRGLGYVVISDERDERDGAILVRPGTERGYGPRRMLELPVTLRVHGRDSHTWQGKLRPLPESEEKNIPLGLSNKAGGPITVKATDANGQSGGNRLVPQSQVYLIYVEIVNPDGAIVPGSRAQVKISCKPETAARWAWRTINNLFDLSLL